MGGGVGGTGFLTDVGTPTGGEEKVRAVSRDTASITRKGWGDLALG